MADARDDVEATASSDNWTAFAAAIRQNRGDFLQFAGVQTVSGLVHAAAKRQMLHHAGIAGQKAMISALGLKPAGGTMLGSGGVTAAGPTAFVASVWFAAEVYRSVEAQKDQIGTAALAAFVNAAFSDPDFIDEAFSDPEERANLREALAYAKYLAYDNLHKAEEGWLNWLSAWVKSYNQDRGEFLKEMDDGRDQALQELRRLLAAESFEVDPGNLTLAAGETHRLSAYATTRSGRAVGNSGFEWTSDAPGTATVSHQGVVTGVSPGEAVVTARAGDAAASITIKVSGRLTDSTSGFNSLSAGGGFNCQLRADGHVLCWGSNHFGESTPPQGSFTFVSAGASHACGVRTNGSVLCWGDDRDGQSTPPRGLFASVAAGNDHSCGVRTDGSVLCWGGTLFEQPMPPAGQFDSISAGSDHTCGVRTDGKVACWDNEGGKSRVVEGSFTAISVGLNHVCGLETDGAVVCWGDNSNGQSAPPDGEFISVSAGWDYTCAVAISNNVLCWGEPGDYDFGQSRSPDGKFVAVSAGAFHVCGEGVDGLVVCWGEDDYGQSTPAHGSFASVSTQDQHTCGVRADGSIVCWGGNFYGESTSPAGEFISVSTGWKHTCGIRANRSLVCWGNNESGESTPPDGEFVSVSAGRGHTCGIRANRSLVCWGNSGESAPPDGKFVSVSAGIYHACGIDVHGTITCWGELFGAEPPLHGSYTLLSSGSDQTCSLTIDGSIVCWGDGHGGKATSPQGSFTSVSTGADHTCGLRADGSVHCWGVNHFGKADAPTGAFESISAGAGHTCGIRPTGSLICWGAIARGDTTATSRPDSPGQADAVESETALADRYLDLLGTVPNTAETRGALWINDYDKIREVFDIVLAGPHDEDFKQLMSDFYQGQRDTAPLLNVDVFLGPFHPYSHSRNREVNQNRRYLAFDYSNMEQTVVVGNVPGRMEVVRGQFDPQRTNEALMACSVCSSLDILRHRGIRFYSWGDDYSGGLAQRLNPPAFDESGRGGRIAVLDSFVFHTTATHSLKSLVDATQKEVSSLADVQPLRLLANGMSRLEAFTMFLSDDVALWAAEDYGRRFYGEHGLQWNEHVDPLEGTGPWLRQYEAFGFGSGVDERGNYMAVALVHAAGDSAEDNAMLLTRVIEQEDSVASGRPWSAIIDLVGSEIHVDGRILLAKIRGKGPRGPHWPQLLYDLDSLILYE